MSGIFISYRREDSQELAGRLFDRLAQRFGRDRVFRDIDAIDPGARFAEVIAERIGGCDAMLALIGKGWLDAKDSQGRRRLELPNDFVKAEIAEALAQNKLVIPLLIEDTPMPARDALPSKIAALTDRNALLISDSRFDFDIGRLVSAISKVVPAEGSATASPDLWSLIQDWLRRRGIPGLVVLAFIMTWWQWDHISKLPGIEPLLARVSQKPLPKAVPGKFNIAVAHLEQDDKRETERLILEALAEFPSVATLSFDRLVASEQGDRKEAEREAHERARTLLNASGADVLISGVVLKQSGKSVPKLYWTPARDVAQEPSARHYVTTQALSLENIFWQDLTSVLALLIATDSAEFAAREGQFMADTLAPFIQRVRGLLKSSSAEQWSAATRARVLAILGRALLTYGEQSGQNEPLREAVDAFREALKEYTREKVPLDWAATQNNLGVALQTLGKLEGDRAQLEEAVDAIREVLKERARDKVPRAWARTQINLGSALETLGGASLDPARLNEAVDAYREALKELPRDKVPLDWATAQANLGNALATLADVELVRERKRDPARLNEAVDAYREALKELPRDKVPLNWATTQTNLGLALWAQGTLTREGDRARLEEATSAFEAALSVFRAVNADYHVRRTELALKRVREEISFRERLQQKLSEGSRAQDAVGAKTK